MNNGFLLKIKNYIDENAMLIQGENVVMGVSGGADSTALLLVMHALKEQYELTLNVVHVNHGLREEAAKEAEYVRELCSERGIPFYLINEDVSKLAKKLSIGTEEAGRKLRYDTFYEILEKTGGGKIAIAHNKNDLTETMLFNLFRGTGVKGLASIPPKRGEIIRPLLCVERWEIEKFLSEEGIPFCTDQSNFSNEYSRNRIRNNVMPVIRDNVTDGVIDHMAEAASQLRELYDYSKKSAERAFRKTVLAKSFDSVSFDKHLFLANHIYIQKLLIKRAIDEIVPFNRDITHVHIESVIDILQKDGTKRVNLPYGIEAVSDYNFLNICIAKEKEEKGFSLDVSGNESVILPDGRKVSFALEDWHAGDDYGQSAYTKTFDYDKIEGRLRLRNREAGDYICVNSQGGTKKLKSYMIDEKIPLEKRDTIPVLAVGSDVLWLIGYRMSEAYKTDENTKRVLKISVSKED